MDQKHGLEYLTEELNYKFSAECPRRGKSEKSIILIHVDDLILTGRSKYINEIFLPKIQDRFDTSVSKTEKIGDGFNFLRRKCKLEKDGLWIQPGHYTQQMLKAHEDWKDQTPVTTIRQPNSDGRQIRSFARARED